MPISIIYILFAFFEMSYSLWKWNSTWLNFNEKFIKSNGLTAYALSGYFVLPSSQTTANFITCETPSTSYITLSQTDPSAVCYFIKIFNDQDWISMDLYFHSTWSSQYFQFTVGSFSYSYTYDSPSTYPLNTGFCNSTPFEVKTLNFTLAIAEGITQTQMKFTSSNTNSGLVSIRNIYISRLQCYPSCSKCTGPEYNQCTGCYYGLPTDNICPPCPSNQYYWKYIGCSDICDIFSSLYYNGFCQSYPSYLIENLETMIPATAVENLKLSLIQDPQHVISTLTIITPFQNAFGIFQFNTGIYRYFRSLASYFYSTYLIGLKITIMLYNDIPINCGIQFKINNTYYGSIYRNTSGIQTHKIKISSTINYGEYSSSSYTKYELISYVDIPKYSFIFSAVGNYTDGTAGWGMSQVKITSGYCSQYCALCEVSFKCKICQSGYYFYRDGSCINGCSNSNQRLSGTYCYDYDDETPYSEYLIQEYINQAADPGQYAQYTLISQSGSNFLKGLDIYFSFWSGNRVFGGPFVWAQAKFQRVHNIINPHHSVTIAFYILFGPSFPSDGQFIYIIDGNTPVSISNVSTFINYDGSKYEKIYEKIIHNTNSLTMTWECYGANNEPINSYCGFYNYYIAVHNCQPYCLQCSDQSTCTLWNSTYDSNIVKFSQAECLSNQYYDKESVRCLTCPSSCLTCTSKLDCKTCQSSYTQSKLGCTCTIYQYEESNQCFDCPIECNQCLSSTYCIECLTTNNRQQSNGQCNCIDGYYPIVSNPKCQLCHQFCKTCVGPTSDECLTCNAIENIEKVGSTCRCPAGKSYQYTTKICSSCHSTCFTCFRTTIDGCLTCDTNLNRLLKGLKCVCAPGYYELSNFCTNCPITEDPSLSQCYKLCSNNLWIWYTITCSTCDPGFQLVSGECQPICGDLQIKGYEQCEDNNTLVNDLCYNCQLQCPVHCLTCDIYTTLPCPDICGDGMITGLEECEDGNAIEYDGCFNCKYQCQPACTKCIKGQCFECATGGWYIDPLITPWQCKERCRDGLIVGSEQCEDGNIDDTDGCKDCRFFCRIGCSSCNYTTKECLSCALPGFAPYSYYCQNVCGDGLVVVDPYGFYSEQCDDGNTFHNDGCSVCKFYCQPTTICKSCVNNRCEICAIGYYLSSKKICISICGDGLIVEGEQCENSFVLPYKGCLNCQAKCQTSCLTCSTTGLGCLSCKTGYNIIDYLCYSICGDKIITEDEQCDDGNLIIGDGCHFCQFSCQDSCRNCLQGICYDCQEAYQLIQSKCYPKCEDGLQKNNEQCEINTSINNYYSCKFNCDLNCLLCQFGLCQQCNDGYELSSNNQYCVKSLQYSFMIVENCRKQIGNSCIQCEDYAYFIKAVQKCELRIAPMSFCHYQLKLSPNVYCSYCFDYCTSCIESNCVICQNGYYLDVNYSCISLCGDGILAQDEQCEIYDQNCFSCMFDTPKFCTLYFEDQCIECEHGFYFNYYNNACESLCGDGKIVNDEDCEDNNYIEFDGCYFCKYSCSQYCVNCLKGVCQQCDQNYTLRDGICYGQQNKIDIFPKCLLFHLNGECLTCEEDFQLNEYGDCIFKCQESCIHCYNGLCFQCAEQYELFKDRCLLIQHCQIGFYLNQELQIRQSSCGDGYVTGWEECDDQNNEKFDGCYQCKYECDVNCIQCIQGVCLQCSQEFYLVQDICLSNCEVTCLNCVLGICQLCNSGYILNEYFICIKINFYNDFCCTPNCENCLNGVCQSFQLNYQSDQFNNQCISIQTLLMINEQPNCKILNNNQCIFCQHGYFDSLTNTCIIDYNMNQCPENCKRCVLSKCIECEFGYYGNKCMPRCGDGIIVQEEECDDGNQYQLDNCLNCKYQCPQYCQSCAYGDCTHCFEGFYLDIVTNTCNSICGDNILAYDEVCDDGNELRYDGCFECKYQCQEACLDCQFGKCILCELPFIHILPKSMCEEPKSCEDLIGLYYDNDSNDCLPQCGDEIVAGNEDCEDLNSIPDDGCHQCKFQCSKNCQVCQDRVCIQCQKSYSLNNYQCLLDKSNVQLNSSIIEETKGNNLNTTIIIGTQNNITSTESIKVEQSSWQDNKLCRDNECVYSKKAIMWLTYNKQLYALQYVDITFDQEVKIQDNTFKDQTLFNINIIDLDTRYYNITINPIQDISFNLSNAKYQIVIDIFQKLSTKSVLLVELNQEVVNSNSQTIFNPSEQIILQVPKIISGEQKQLSNYAQSSNKAFMIGAITICAVSLVSGQSSFVIETLNLLQYQSFLRFINVDYPENLYIYFQAQELLSITTYLQLFEIDEYLNLITRKEKQIELNGKFQLYRLEADLFTNIVPQLIQCLVLITLLYFAENFYNILFRLSNNMRQIKHEMTIKSKILFIIMKLILVCKNGFKSLIKTKYLQKYDQIIQLLYVNSSDLIFKVILQLHYTQMDNLRSKLSTFSASLIFFTYIGLLLKSFSVSNDPKKKNVIAILNLKYIALDIFRTTFFHIALILLQEQQILQCLSISISSMAQCYIIYKYKSCSQLDRIIFLIIEGVLTVFSLSLFLYFDIGQLYFSQEKKITLGFIQMAFLIACLGIVFVKQLFPKIQKIWKLIFKKNDVKHANSQLFS